MSIDRKTFIVVNPNSANASTGREWPQMEETIRNSIGPFDWRFTAGSKDATRLTREAITKGYDQIVAVGGDGTNNEVVNGFFDERTPLNPDCAFSFICRGTGGDFRKTFGWSTDLQEAIDRIEKDDILRIDLGRFSYIDHKDETALSHFINITSFGISGVVDNYVNNTTKLFGGRVSFFMGSFRALWNYRNKHIHLKVDDHFDENLTINNVAVANGRVFGGGMIIAPEASLTDGMFDVTIMGDYSRLEMIGMSGDIYKGTHLERSRVQSVRGKTVVAESDEIVLIDMDGEQPGRLPCRFENLPGALALKTGQDY